MRARLGPSALLLILLAACGGGESESSRATATTSSSPPTSPTPTPDSPADPPAPSIDLLHAVDASIAVSSVYRDRAEYAARLADGDLTTAWNSRTGELVGAFVDVRLPEQVEVSAIALTVGFTKRTDASDLFTGNVRIAEVRVSHGGQVVGTFPLDVESRELQSIPITGGGGRYRIEVTRVTPGSHADWQEICVSELQVLGRSALAHPGERTPRAFVGALPPPPPPVDLVALGARWASHVTVFERSFVGYEWQATRIRSNTDTELAAQDASDVHAQFVALARRTATLVDPVDGLAGDRIRSLADAERLGSIAERGAQLATMIDGLSTVAERIGTDEARCTVARAHARIRFERIAAELQSDRELAEIDRAFGAAPPRAESASAVGESIRDSRRLVTASRALFARSPREALASLEGHPVERVSADVAPLLAAIRAAAERCPAE